MDAYLMFFQRAELCRLFQIKEQATMRLGRGGGGNYLYMTYSGCVDRIAPL